MEETKIVKYQSRGLQKVNNAISITNKLLSINVNPINIFWLEDHKIFIDSLSICIHKKFPNALIKHFKDGDEALEYLINCNKKSASIDLIITDHNHPGMKGIDFVRVVRQLEIGNKYKIPILFITMIDDSGFVKQVEDIPLTKHLTKTSSCVEINFAISNMLF